MYAGHGAGVPRYSAERQAVDGGMTAARVVQGLDAVEHGEPRVGPGPGSSSGRAARSRARRRRSPPIALSKQSPTEPIDRAMPASRARRPKGMLVYWVPGRNGGERRRCAGRDREPEPRSGRGRPSIADVRVCAVRPTRRRSSFGASRRGPAEPAVVRQSAAGQALLIIGRERFIAVATSARTVIATQNAINAGRASRRA